MVGSSWIRQLQEGLPRCKVTALLNIHENQAFRGTKLLIQARNRKANWAKNGVINWRAQSKTLLTVRSMSTEAAILKAVMSLMTATGQMMSITLLWIRISYLSQVLVPSPQGDFLVVTLKILVGILRGPLVSYPSSFPLALLTSSAQACSSGLTSRLLSVSLKD